MAFCRNCGNRINASDMICRSCNARQFNKNPPPEKVKSKKGCLPSFAIYATITFIVILGISKNEDEKKEELRKEELRKEEQRQAKIDFDYFEKSPESRLGMIKKYIDEQKYTDAVNLAKKYQESKNQELHLLMSIANSKLAEQRTEFLFNSLKNIKTDDYQKLVDIYSELHRLNPDNKSINDFLASNTKKLNEILAIKLKQEEHEKSVVEAKSSPEKFLQIAKSSWNKTGFDTIAELSITIKNNSPITIKDIGIICSFYGNSPTKIDEERTIIYDYIGAGSTKTFKNINLGFIGQQVTRAGCEINSAEGF